MVVPRVGHDSTAQGDKVMDKHYRVRWGRYSSSKVNIYQYAAQRGAIVSVVADGTYRY